MIAWLKIVLGIDALRAMQLTMLNSMKDINTRLEHVANRVTNTEKDILDLDNYVFPRKHKQ